VVALFGISGEYTDTIISYEVEVIYIRDDKYGEREHIATNSDFGRDRSRCYNNKERALKYYDELNAILRDEQELY